VRDGKAKTGAAEFAGCRGIGLRKSLEDLFVLVGAMPIPVFPKRQSEWPIMNRPKAGAPL